MTKTRSIAMGLGIVAALALTATAGVAAGRSTHDVGTSTVTLEGMSGMGSMMGDMRGMSGMGSMMGDMRGMSGMTDMMAAMTPEMRAECEAMMAQMGATDPTSAAPSITAPASGSGSGSGGSMASHH